VRLVGLQPQTTYYYWVTSMGADGKVDPVKSGINQFSTAAPGKVILSPIIRQDMAASINSSRAITIK
jgi:hypothetical protein